MYNTMPKPEGHNNQIQTPANCMLLQHKEMPLFNGIPSSTIYINIQCNCMSLPVFHSILPIYKMSAEGIQAWMFSPHLCLRFRSFHFLLTRDEACRITSIFLSDFSVPILSFSLSLIISSIICWDFSQQKSWIKEHLQKYTFLFISLLLPYDPFPTTNGINVVNVSWTVIISNDFIFSISFLEVNKLH